MSIDPFSGNSGHGATDGKVHMRPSVAPRLAYRPCRRPSHAVKKAWKQLKEMKMFDKRLPMILPSNPWRRRWDFLILFLVIYNAIMVPFTAAFAIIER